MSEQFTMPRKLAHELLGAIFNGPGLNPAGHEALKQDFAARLRTAPAASTTLAAKPLLKAVNAIARQLMGEQSTAPDGADEEDFAAGKMAGTVQFAAEMIKHIHAAAPEAAGALAPASTVADLLAPQPLTEPVHITKALLAHREARVVMDGGTGPPAAVHLVNIGLTGWVHTKDTATAFADGYNLALKQLRAALLGASESSTTPERNQP